MKFLLNAILFQIAAFGAAASLSASLLGDNHVGAGVGYGRVDLEGSPLVLEGWGAGAGIHYAIARESNYGFDIDLTYSAFDVSDRHVSSRGNTMVSQFILYTGSGFVRPFASLDLGWTWDRFIARGSGGMPGVSSSTDSWMWGFSAGAEFNLTETFSLTPAIGWMRAEDYDASEWEGSVTAHQWLTESLGVGATYTFSEGPDHGHTLIALFSVRF